MVRHAASIAVIAGTLAATTLILSNWQNRQPSVLLHKAQPLEPVSNCIFDPILGATHCNSAHLYFSGCSTEGCTSVTGVQEEPYAQTYSGNVMYTGDQAQVLHLDPSKGEDGQIDDTVTLANPLPIAPPPPPPPTDPTVLYFPSNFDVATAPADLIRAAGGISNLQEQIGELATALSSNTINLLRIQKQQDNMMKDWAYVTKKVKELRATAGPRGEPGERGLRGMPGRRGPMGTIGPVGPPGILEVDNTTDTNGTALNATTNSTSNSSAAANRTAVSLHNISAGVNVTTDAAIAAAIVHAVAAAAAVPQALRSARAVRGNARAAGAASAADATMRDLSEQHAAFRNLGGLIRAYQRTAPALSHVTRRVLRAARAASAASGGGGGSGVAAAAAVNRARNGVSAARRERRRK